MVGALRKPASKMMLLNQCSSSCGYVAAFVSCLSFGSFALPMKSRECRECDVHPLVFQSYKTLWCFLTSFSVLFLGVDRLEFSPWGLVSGMFWIPAGITYVCGIRTAGLAICHGTTASVIVIVSFSWGIFVFGERVRSISSALFAVFLMVCGIFGMSFASAPPPAKNPKTLADGQVFAHASDAQAAKRAIFCFRSGCLGDRLLTWCETGDDANGKKGKKKRKPDADESDESESLFGDEEQPPLPPSAQPQEHGMGTPRVSKKTVRSNRIEDTISSNTNLSHVSSATPPQRKTIITPRRLGSLGSNIPPPPQSAPSPLTSVCAAAVTSPPVVQSRSNARPESQEHDLARRSEHEIDTEKQDPRGLMKGLKATPGPGSIGSNGGAEAIVKGMCRHLRIHYGMNISTRQLGLIIAGFGAIWGGSVMVPLHFAGEKAQGLGFVFSFAIGATTVNCLVWVICILDALRRHGCDCGAAFASLPQLHVSKLFLPGSISGILWSIGNMASMISVTYLGEGVGYSMTQSAMLVSGLWGIFLFKEITNPAAIRGWLASACLTIAGILLLSYNHLPAGAPKAVVKHSF